MAQLVRPVAGAEIKSAEVAEHYRDLLSQLDRIADGYGVVTTTSSLDITINTGHAYIKGKKVGFDTDVATIPATLAAGLTNHVFLKNDGTIVVNTTGIAPANSIKIYVIVASATGVANPSTDITDLRDGFAVRLSVDIYATKFIATTSITTPTIGPSSSQQHTLPAVASDTVALLAATQTFTNKTLTSPIINNIAPSANFTLTQNGVAVITSHSASAVVNTLVLKEGRVGIGTADPAASAIFELVSTTKGFLMPRMTTSQRDAISSPATGLFVFNTTTGRLNYYGGAAWLDASPLSGTGVANRVTYWSGTETLTSSADFTWDGSKLSLNEPSTAAGLRDVLVINRSKTPVANDGITQLFSGKDAAGNVQSYAAIDILFTSVADGAEGAAFAVRIADGAGTLVEAFRVTSGKVMQFASDTVANIYRVSSGVLKTDGGFTIAGVLTVGSSDVTFTRTGTNTVQVPAALILSWGGDVSLFRQAAGILKSSGSFEVGSDLRIAADAGRLYFGAALDTSFYRPSAGVIKTDGALQLVGSISLIRNVAYTWPSSQGSANQLLQNDGSGNLTWAAGGVSTDTPSRLLLRDSNGYGELRGLGLRGADMGIIGLTGWVRTTTYAASAGSDGDGAWDTGQPTQDAETDGASTVLRKYRYDSGNGYRLNKVITTVAGKTETAVYGYDGSGRVSTITRTVA